MTARLEAPSRFRPLLSTSEWGGRCTRAEVNLDAIARNVASVRKHIHASRLMAVVKADAYGHGAAPVARMALASGASWIGVYTVSEGVRLRESGIEAPILIFGPFQRVEAQQIVRHRLTPTIHTLEAGGAIQQEAPTDPVNFHIKIDTGLSRSGIDTREALPILRVLAGLTALRLQGIYTHFARADEPLRPETETQLALFLKTIQMLERNGFKFQIKHAANTGATLSFAATHLDMARLGVGIYGYHPSPGAPRGPLTLSPALSLVTALVRVHKVSAGTGVGYGHEFVCSRDTFLGLAPIGYGDGLPRTLGNGSGHVLVRGRAAPIVGRMSMDQITLDLTDIPDAAVDDVVTLIGSSGSLEHDADDLATEAGTISYDILTGLLPRVPRLYARGDRLYLPNDVFDPVRQ